MPKKLRDFVAAARSRIQEVSPEALEEMRAQRPDLLILDVRETYEFEEGHIEGAHCIPRGLLEPAADPDYKRPDPVLSTAYERPVVVYCSTGGRSALAAATLMDMGYAEVYNLAGGCENWLAEDLPMVTGAAPRPAPTPAPAA
ncbi:rhodanese-like domain-containing protein [Ectothiorhodospiraceae bacterium 2226]|nr:rhodanese-like domain-containing protein [Ectothiorhodospiraceae bacterium 2226]